MAAHYYTRYGHGGSIDSINEEQVIANLLGELRNEQQPEPDDEHTQVSIGNEHWSVTVQVSGLVTFDNIDILEGLPSELPENLYLRNVADDTVKAIWRAVTRGDGVSLLSHSWVAFDELSPYTKDFYRNAR